MKIYCDRGIDEIMFLSGNAEEHEYNNPTPYINSAIF